MEPEIDVERDAAVVELASKKLFTSRQPDSTSVEASDMKAAWSPLMKGNSPCPSFRHSADRSWERWERASRKATNRSRS